MQDSDVVRTILDKGEITAEGVLELRRHVFWKGVVTQPDAETVLMLNDRLGGRTDASWSAFFVEALTDYLVFQADPSGYVSEENADWLISKISHSGHVDTECELELLIKILERSTSSPLKLVSFALRQVRIGVLEGDGYVGRNRKLEPGIVGEDETELVRRVLFAFGGDGNVAVTRQEAEILIEINDATAEAGNHPAWSDLFVKALANFFMAASGYQVPTRQEALRREAWLDAPTQGVGAFMGQMLAGSLDAIWECYRYVSADPEGSAAAQPPSRSEPRVSEAEVAWAAERLGRDGKLHVNEVALINFLKTHDAHLHPKLLPILDLAA